MPFRQYDTVEYVNSLPSNRSAEAAEANKADQSLTCRDEGSGFRVQGLGFRVYGVQGLRFHRGCTKKRNYKKKLPTFVKYKMKWKLELPRVHGDCGVVKPN